MPELLTGPSLPPAKGGDAKQLIILLHGYGADGSDLISFAPVLAPHFPEAMFIAPNAPFPCEMSPHGRQWFSLRGLDPALIMQGLLTASDHLDHFITETLKALNLSDDKLAFIGFSQGTMMALHTGLRREKACAGIVGFAGKLLAPHLLAEQAKSKPPVCLIHGDADPVVPYGSLKEAEDALREHGITIETHTRRGLSHSIDEGGVQAGLVFLKQYLS